MKKKHKHEWIYNGWHPDLKDDDTVWIHNLCMDMKCLKKRQRKVTRNPREGLTG